MNNYLTIAGFPVKIDSSIVIRWVDTSEGKAIPVLYVNGRRVTKSWKMSFACSTEADPNGSNANTD